MPIHRNSLNVDFSVVEADLSGLELDLLAIPYQKEFKDRAEDKASKLAGEGFSRAIELKDFRGDKGESLLVYTASDRIPRVLVVGLGDLSPSDSETVRIFGGYVAQKVQGLNVSRVGAYLDLFDLASSVSTRSFFEGFSLGVYRYSLKSGSDSGRSSEKKYSIYVAGDPEAKAELDRAKKVVESVYLARDLGNAPPSTLNPETFELFARELVKGSRNLELKVFRRDDLERMGMNGILSVGRGSSVEPRLLVVSYRGGSTDPVAFVGKGITFDSGGYNIKTAQGMREMKFDMSGAAAVLASLKAISDLGLEINVYGLIPLAENLISGSSYKPGDVIKMYNGTTIEVDNTDAEGRIILGDAIAYASKDLNAKVIVDLATLTGAIIVALGSQAAGLFSNSDRLASMIEEASKRTGERVWRMPLWDDYLEDIKSEVADIKNTGVQGAAGAQAGAAFLSRFAEGSEWAHLDIAGVAWVQREGPRRPYYPKGATGYGVRLLVELAKMLSYG